MLRLFLMASLVVVSNSAMAKWIEMGKNEGYAVYAKPPVVSKDGKTSKMWSLIDLNAPETTKGHTYLSIAEQYEYDCAEEKTKLVAFSWYSKNMAGGDVVLKDTQPKQWEKISPKSAREFLWKNACKKMSPANSPAASGAM